MRVLHIASGIEAAVGGPVTALKGLTLAQHALGMRVGIVSTYRDSIEGSPIAGLRSKGIDVELIGPARGRLSRHSRIRPMLMESIGNADIVHIHALWEEIQHQAAVVAHRLSVPYIFRPCGMLDPWSLSQNRWAKQFFLAWRLRKDLNGAAAIHFTADAERDLAAAAGLTPPTLVEPNGVDLEAFRQLPIRGAFRQRFGIAANRPLVLFLSRIHPKKGLDLLIPAFASVLARCDREHGPVLAIVGPDSGDNYQADVEKMIDAHAIGNRVVWTGMLEGAEKVQAYVDSDLYVLPSYQENFGIVVAEAMAAGLPVIISDKVNLDRDVIAADAGEVVPTRVEPLADALARWITDATVRKNAGTAGRTYAFSRFSWTSIAERWLEHYQTIQHLRRTL